MLYYKKLVQEYLKEEDAKIELELNKKLQKKKLCNFSSKNTKALFLIESLNIFIA
jgi:hypothetical protein